MKKIYERALETSIRVRVSKTQYAYLSKQTDKNVSRLVRNLIDAHIEANKGNN